MVNIEPRSMKKDNKDLIVEAFKRMDESLLEVTLDDSRTYQEAGKTTFINKLLPLFAEIKDSGDSCLKAYPGECKSTECNFRCKGYSFVGENSGKHLDLVFMEKEGEITDIYHCSDFGTEEIVMGRKERLGFIINIDDHADFKPGLSFILNQKECRRALAELKALENQIIPKSFFLNWIREYRPVYNFFKRPPLFYNDFNEFHSFYWKFEELFNYSLLEPIAANALEFYQKSNLFQEEELLGWLLKYESVGMKLLSFSYQAELDEQLNLPYLNVCGFKIDAADFTYIFQFKAVFEDKYGEMTEKYRIPLEKKIIDGEEVEEKQYYLLSELLKWRR
jgi:hypothetical protein